MGQNQSCGGMCTNVQDFQRDNHIPPKRKEYEEQSYYKASQLQSKIDITKQNNNNNNNNNNIHNNVIRDEKKLTKRYSQQLDKSFSYSFSNFGYCREEAYIRNMMENNNNYQDEINKGNRLEIIGSIDNLNQNNTSQMSGYSLLNYLNEGDQPIKEKEAGIKPRDFKIILDKNNKISQQSNHNNNKSPQPNNRNSTKTLRNSTSTYQTNTSSKNQTMNSQFLSKQIQQFQETPHIGQYEKIKLLSQSKISSVYLVQKEKIPLAMKIIKKNEIKYQNQIENIWTERRILERLDSSHTVRLESAFVDEDHIYIITDYKPNGNLLQYLKRNKLTLQEIKKIIAQTISCLQYLHEEQKILYRALSLDNILLDEFMNVSLCDFGNSKIIQSKRQINTSFVYDMKEENQSPEQARQKHQDTSSDYWQLGILTYQLIYKRHPFKVNDRKQTLINIQNCTRQSVLYNQFSHNNEQITSEWIEFIQYCLTSDKMYRPHTFYDIQQTSLFEGFEWQEVLEGYINKYTQTNDLLYKYGNQNIINNNICHISCDYNPHFLLSINHDSLIEQQQQQNNHLDDDIATTIVLPNSNHQLQNNNNNTCYSNHSKNTQSSTRTGNKSTLKQSNNNICENIIQNQNEQQSNNQFIDDGIVVGVVVDNQLKKQSTSCKKNLRKSRNTLSVQSHCRQSSLYKSSKEQQQFLVLNNKNNEKQLEKQDTSNYGDDENDSNEDESFIEQQQQQLQRQKSKSKSKSNKIQYKQQQISPIIQTNKYEIIVDNL